MTPSRRTLIIALLLNAALASSTCGATPAAPSPSTAATALTLAPSITELAVGATIDLTLIVTFADGRRTQVSPTWGSSDPAVLKVQPISSLRNGMDIPEDLSKVIDHILVGRLTGISVGDADVYAVCEHGRAERRIHVTAR